MNTGHYISVEKDQNIFFVRDGMGEGEGGWGSTDMLLSSLVELLSLIFSEHIDYNYGN